MSHVIQRLPPVIDGSPAEINLRLTAINESLASIGDALDAFEAPGTVANLQTNAKGIVVRLVPAVPALYDSVYLADVVVTLVAKINELLDHLREHNLID